MLETAKLLYKFADRIIKIFDFDIKLFPDIINADIACFGANEPYTFIRYSDRYKWCSIDTNIISYIEYRNTSMYKDYITLENIINKLLSPNSSLAFFQPSNNINPIINSLLEMSDEELELLIRMS